LQPLQTLIDDRHNAKNSSILVNVNINNIINVLIAMDSLDRLLTELRQCLGDDGGAQDPVSIAENIEAVALSETNDADKLLCMNMLFKSDSPPNLLTFIKECIGTKEKSIINTKVKLLKFIALFVKLNVGNMDHYAPLVVCELFSVLKREDNGPTRTALLIPIKTILRVYWRQEMEFSKVTTTVQHADSIRDAMAGEKIAIEDMYDKLIADLRFNKKTSPKTMKSETLKVLGLLVAAYPTEKATRKHVVKVVEVTNKILDRNFSSGGDADLSIIASAFSCLDRCCHENESTVFTDEETKRILFQYLRQGLSSLQQDDVKRYAIARKALRFLENHAAKLRQYIGQVRFYGKRSYLKYIWRMENRHSFCFSLLFLSYRYSSSTLLCRYA
jgi:hypothetical protein